MRNDAVPGFTRRFRIHGLVWCVQHEDMPFAITREKTIKGWRRRWKIELIESTTPDWRDIHPDTL